MIIPSRIEMSLKRLIPFDREYLNFSAMWHSWENVANFSLEQVFCKRCCFCAIFDASIYTSRTGFKSKYCISSYSFCWNYSFLKLEFVVWRQRCSQSIYLVALIWEICYETASSGLLLVSDSLSRQPWSWTEVHKIHCQIIWALINPKELLINKDILCKLCVGIALGLDYHIYTNKMPVLIFIMVFKLKLFY